MMFLNGTLGDRWGAETSPSGFELQHLNAANGIAPGIVEQAGQIMVAGESWISAIARAITTVSMADAQRRLLNLQLERAQQGLAPLDSSQYGLGVSVGLGGDTQKMILLGVGALALVFLLTSRRR